jgi:rhodanese-related sulfurtransferase
MNQLTAQALAQWLADSGRAQPVLLDVREAWEVQSASLPGITHIPMQEIPARLSELDAGREIVSICHHGGRSMQVAVFLERHGLKLHNLTGGMDAWSREVDPSVPRY